MMNYELQDEEILAHMKQGAYIRSNIDERVLHDVNHKRLCSMPTIQLDRLTDSGIRLEDDIYKGGQDYWYLPIECKSCSCKFNFKNLEDGLCSDCYLDEN